MPAGGANSERVLILAPHGRDAEVASKVLREAGWPTLICADIAALCVELARGAAFSVVTEEAVATADVTELEEWIRAQPAWSDFPTLILTGRGDAPGRNALAQRFQDILGNASLLERPFHPTTLVSMASSALRSRRRQYEARELLGRYELLAQELQHRTKNLLAIIQSIATASLEDTQQRETFFARLHALARAQDLVTESDGLGAPIEAVVEQALESFGARISIDGPHIFLNPSAAQGFALIMHELATNAAKHGALSSDTGIVSVCWSLDPKSAESILFRWQERGGPPVTPPTRKGFGSRLLERAVSNIDQPAHFDYAPEGLTYEVRAPLAVSRQHQHV